jgi:hypothetical protein
MNLALDIYCENLRFWARHQPSRHFNIAARNYGDKSAWRYNAPEAREYLKISQSISFDPPQNFKNQTA